MRLYIAVVESGRRKGKRVKLAIHAASKKAAMAAAKGKFTNWTLRSLNHAPGRRCIAFLDETPV
jgi:hypothetical protein